MLSNARSRGTLVKRDVTSKVIKMSESRTCLPESELYKLKLSVECLLAFSRVSDIMSCKNETMEYRAVLTEETII